MQYLNSEPMLSKVIVDLREGVLSQTQVWKIAKSAREVWDKL